MSPKKAMQESAESTAVGSKKPDGFSEEERGAMKQRLQELKTEGRRKSRAEEPDLESVVLAKIAEMPEPDRSMAERIHAIIKASAPFLTPRLWYGMPAYAKNGNVICFFQDARKFKTRYATLGFSDKAMLDDGELWPVAYAVKEMNAAVVERISALVKKAAS